MHAIHLAGVTKRFGRTTVLDGVDLAVPRGTVQGLLGPNGAGKTTLVNIMSTLLRADAGTVAVNGHDAAAEPAAVRASISTTGQFAAIDELLTVRENLMLFSRLHRLPRGSARRRTDELLERFDLASSASRRVSALSGGMRRRVDIAVGLVTSPPVVFLDEPTTGLDPRSRADVWALVRELAADGATVLLTTQYLEEADALADSIAVLDAGRIVANGTARELKARIGSDQVEVEFSDGGRGTFAAGGGLDGLRAALDRIEASGRPVADVAVRKPSLDDVFLALTGHAARAAAEDDAGAAPGGPPRLPAVPGGADEGTIPTSEGAPR
ncbi:ATP-binding cassette domain-containing protein [Zafaria sp. Z1313]|uniref:ABC transporter ATP-binding protein n=1 Tax=unclassified Zafaria TaxID=2828765 RepID=UPI002E76F57B|nr:ATP-binding cassette domain-containing protein [Zafaria sp. J156]MEE1621613.1 ATP-binding cassette domain-containing protein [Zafaria sp. J156]